MSDYNFRLIGYAPELSGIENLNWSEYTFRQDNFGVHKETLTVPLVWNENLNEYPPKIIRHKNYGAFEGYLDQLQFFLGGGAGGHIQTAILIKLPAGKSISPHVDSAPFFKNFHRVHIPIVTNPQCLFTVGDETIHMKKGEMWEIDNDNKVHSVDNGGADDRVHLLIDFYSLKLRVSTANRFLMFDTFDKKVRVVHEGSGVYYGSVGEWTVSRPDGIGKDCLLSVRTNERVGLPSGFTHDFCRFGDKLYIADCANGGVVVLSYPEMKLLRHLKPFTRRDHINTVLCEEEGKLWCLLHSLGKSKLVQISAETGEWLQVLTDVGTQSHGIIRFQEGFLILSSGTSELLFVSSGGASQPKVLWKDSTETFLKGLCVSPGGDGNVAYFGIAPLTERMDRQSLNLQCEIAAFDLKTNTLMWRHKIDTNGLLNSIVCV
jgi:quercetin dioxygenase-like cupin family protein